MSKFCKHGDYGQACPRCHYEAHDGKCCCESCKLIRSEQRIAELEQQRDELLAALKLWKIASDNAEESELDDMACYCVPMPLFCDAEEAIDAAIAKVKP